MGAMSIAKRLYHNETPILIQIYGIPEAQGELSYIEGRILVL